MPSRYYSQQYEPVDDPSAPPSNIGLNQYTQYDRPVTPEVNTEYDRTAQYDDAPTRFEPPRSYQPDTQYPQPTSTRGVNPAYDQAMNQDVHAPSSPVYEDFDAIKRPGARPAKKSWQAKATSWWASQTAWWNRQTRKRKYIILGSVAAFVVILIIIIAVAAAASGSSFHYTQSFAKVTNDTSFATGGATETSPQSNEDGIGAGADVYQLYTGDASNFPTSDKWVSFQNMWDSNQETFKKSCGWLEEGPDNTPEMIQDIYDAIQNRSTVSLVDHRFILAVILQESHGCVRVSHTESSGGVRNPGLMQSHNGHAYDSSNTELSILQMVQDGTQGTEHGDGLVQNLNMYGDPFSAARGYNSGYIPKSGDLTVAAGATKCYVTDIANRLTGWVTADSGCDEDST